MKRKPSPAFNVDCVVNFWDLASYAEMDAEELFYKMWPDDMDYEEIGDKYVIIDVFNETVYAEEDEVREMWETIRFYIEDCGYRFYDKVMFIF